MISWQHLINISVYFKMNAVWYYLQTLDWYAVSSSIIKDPRYFFRATECQHLSNLKIFGKYAHIPKCLPMWLFIVKYSSCNIWHFLGTITELFSMFYLIMKIKASITIIKNKSHLGRTLKESKFPGDRKMVHLNHSIRTLTVGLSIYIARRGVWFGHTGPGYESQNATPRLLQNVHMI